MLLTLVTAAALAAPPSPDDERPTLYGGRLVDSVVVDDVWRGGFHLQIAFGLGGGLDTEGLHHNMEIGGTFRNGITLALLHTFVQNKGLLRDKGGPDLVGGWLAEIKVPIGRPEVVGKFAIGPGGLHDQSNGIQALLGPCVAWGVDLHLPVSRRSGPTIGLTAVHTVVDGVGYHTVSLGVGYTLF